MSSAREVRLRNEIVFRNEMLNERGERMVLAADILHDLLDNYECGDNADEMLTKALNILCGNIAI